MAAGTVTATTTPAALSLGLSATAPQAATVVVQADPDNSNDVYAGDAGAQPIHLKAGDTATLTATANHPIYVKTLTGTAIVNWEVIVQ